MKEEILNKMFGDKLTINYSDKGLSFYWEGIEVYNITDVSAFVRGISMEEAVEQEFPLLCKGIFDLINGNK